MGVQLKEEHTVKAAEPKQPAAFAFAAPPPAEQLSLLTDDLTVQAEANVFHRNTQDANADQGDVFPRNTPSVPDSVVDRILASGGNHCYSIERVAAFFMRDNITGSAAASFLQQEYETGGKGFRISGVDYALWFDETGLRIAEGRGTRTARTVTLSWPETAGRIQQLLQVGRYAAGKTLEAALSNEYRELAVDLASASRERSNAAVQRGYLAQTAAWVKETNLESILPDDTKRKIVAGELAAYVSALKEEPGLCQYPRAAARAKSANTRLAAIEHMTVRFPMPDDFQPERPAFITEDEIDALLCSGNGYHNGRLDIYSYFKREHTPKECVSFLRHSYGIGGRGSFGTDEWHDNKGIRLRRSDTMGEYACITVNWTQVEKRIRKLIRENRYLTPDEMEQYESRYLEDTEPETPDNSAAQGDVFQANTQETAVQTTVGSLTQDNVFQGNTLRGQEVADPHAEKQSSGAEQSRSGKQDFSNEYQLLDRLRADCEYFLGAGQRNEKHLWAGGVYAQIAKMRELYDALPEKPEWLTKETIDSYEDRMSPRYQVVVYHLVENGFDEKQDFQTLEEAEKAAQGYVRGTMEADGFAYDGAAVYDYKDHKYIRIWGNYPDQAAQAQVDTPAQTEAPYIICDWSESPVFEDGKRYSIYEFDRLMKQADDEQVAGKNAALKKYGTWESWYEADDPENAQFLGYDKTKFTIVMPDGQTYTERQDIGDGDGGMLDFLSRYPKYQSILPILRQAAAADPSHDVFQGNTSEERAAPKRTVRTVKEIYDQYLAVVKEKVMADTAYQNACMNSDEENARIEADAAIQRAAVSIRDTEFLRLYYDLSSFHNRLHKAVFDVTYPALHTSTEQLASSDDVFQGNTLEEAAQAAAAAPSRDVFQSNTQPAADLETAKQLINAYTQEEFGTESDFSDLSDIGLAYSTTEDNAHEIQVSADLVSFCINYTVSNEVVRKIQCSDLNELNDYLANLSFTEMVADAEQSYYEQQPQPVSRDVFQSNTLGETTQAAPAPYDPLAPAYQTGTMVYLDNAAYMISRMDQTSVWLKEAASDGIELLPMSRTVFENRLFQDARNGTITEYLTTDPTASNDDLRESLTSENGLLDTQDKALISRWFRAGEGNTRIAQKMSETYAGTTGALSLLSGECADYTATTTGFSVELQDRFGTEISRSWKEIARLCRAMYQQEKDGFVHDPAPDPEPRAETPAYQKGDQVDIVYGDKRITGMIDYIGDIEVHIQTGPYSWSSETINRKQFEACLRRGILREKTYPTDAHTDVFHGNTPEEAAQPAATDPSYDVFHGNTLEETARNESNYHITDDLLGVSSPRERYRNNIAAIRLLRTLEEENRPASPDEQDVLAQYTGWGAIPQAFDAANPAWASEYAKLKGLLTDDEYKAARASTLNAHYTSPTVIETIYDALDHIGLVPESILEPSCGTGNFFGLLPESMSGSRLYGVELDSITGRIAQKLYPDADITVSGFENTAFSDNTFDLAIGNIPFGDYKLHDKRYDKDNLLIHDYFFVKTLDKVKPNGIVAFITSKGTLDKKDEHVRRLLAQKADLLGAIRLPNNAFKANAGTEVTADILFLQKRETPPETEPEWVQLGETADGLSMNRYFISHPEMILGEMKMESTRYGYDTTCAPLPGADLKEQLAEAVRHISVPDKLPARGNADVFQWNTSQDTQDTQEEIAEYSYFVRDGKLFFRAAGQDVPSTLNKTAEKRARAMIGISHAVRKLIAEQADGCDNERLHELQDELNRLYDSFVKEYGYIRSNGNRLAFSKDAAYPLLLALEELDDEQNVKGKSDIFTQRTIRPHVAVTEADTPQDALGLSLAERGHIDFHYMSSLLGGMPEEQIISALHGQIFREPVSGKWQPADEYLSGNIREKLKTAKAYAEQDPSFSVNVRMLESVLPEPLTAADISVRLGTKWIPPEDITQFVREVLHPPFYAADKISVDYSDAVKRWHVANKSADHDRNSLAYTKYGTARVSGYELLELALNLRDVQVFDVKIVDGKEKRIPNPHETIKARNKQDALRQAFKDWIYSDPDRRARLVDYYNEHFNHTRPRTFNGDYLTFPGMNPNIEMRKHQRDAVARILYGGNALLAHCVGAGKTWTMAAAAMELRRLGLAHKPMFVVPNSLTEQWGADFQQLYPGARILVATENDFSKQNRKAFCARIATGDYDAVIIGHSQFEKIPLSPEQERAHVERQLDDLELSLSEAKNSKSQNFTIKQLESSKKKLEARLEKLMDAKEKDDTVTFEQLGVDRLFVDEADEFKNLGLFTKMRNVAGIQNTAAQKSEDMAAKCEYLNEQTGYKGVVFATGTPISNSMSELYTMMRYLQYDVLEQTGMTDFDSWASSFGETVSAMELSPEGSGYRMKTRFAKFVNLPELMNLWKLAADIQTADMLHLPRPEVEYHNELSQPTPEQKAMVQQLGKRADAVRSGSVAPYEDNMLSITNDGRKLALDQRLADPALPDVPESKLNRVVENVYDIWQRTTPDKGTQLIFCDLATPSGKGQRKNSFCAYDDIRDKLIARGVPAEEIAFIHDADTTPKKRTLRQQMNAGKIRILIGSTGKMGAGFNVQKRLVAEHEVDCPWRPRDVEQREGRILRQGNTNPRVDIYRYATEGTFDSYNWQTVENKQKFIAQVMTSKSPARTCEDIDAAALSYAEIKALAAGDPKIKERMELEVEVNKLSVLRSAYQNERFRLQDDARVNLPHEITKKEILLAALKRDAEMFAANHAQSVGDTFRMEISGQTYTNKEEAGRALLDRMAYEAGKIQAGSDEALGWDSSLEVGQYCGFSLRVTRDPLQNIKLWVQGKTRREVDAGSTPQGVMQRLGNALASFEPNISSCEKSIARLQDQLENAKVEAEKPWPQEDEYQIKTARLNELNFLLSKKDDQPQLDLKGAQPEAVL
ncbi:LPD11 domain-containing protein [Agathobaculum massiliense]|uniref:LPD11 domain-containing protein n=1 Tax=Agathobaculum massiliense TaxID=3014267 RepID=UPI0036F36810